RIKEATDNLRQEFIKSTGKTLKTIKQQKDIKCNQIRIDMANWSTKLFEHTLKKIIRNGTIYNLIHELEEKDSKSYSNISWKKLFIHFFHIVISRNSASSMHCIVLLQC